MKFKDYKKEIKSEEISTPDIRNRIDTEYEGKPASKKMRFPLFLKIMVPTMAAIVVALFVVIAVTNRNTLPTVSTLSQSSKMAVYKSKKDLNNTVSYENDTRNGLDLIFNLGSPKGAMAVDDRMYEQASTPTSDSANQGSTTNEVSRTNTQFENVDEADIVKADSKNIYRVSNGKLLINSVNNGVIGETQTITIFDADTNKLLNTELYLTDKYVIVVSTLFEYNTDPSGNYGYSFYCYSYSTNYTVVNVYDIDELKLVKSFKGKGSLVDSRLVFNEDTNLNTLYFIYVESIIKNDNDCNLPVEEIDGNKVTTPYDQIYYCDECMNKAYTHFISIKLDDTLATNSIVQTGPHYYHTVYVDENSIYLVSDTYKYNMELYIKNRISCYEYLESIIKYTINDGEITPIASLLVSGSILNQFAMDEKDGYLRLALAETNHNKIEIYNLVDGKFELTGSITEGLGLENETIKSARFNGDTCLVVTAKNTDPLYKIDLSDPTNPVILGKFKEDGYNSYLQYLDGELEGYAFALGYNTEDISDYYNVRTGCKFDLYNIKGNDPVELDEINYDVYDIEAVYNHKAIFVYKNFIGFEVNKTYHLYQITDSDEDLVLKEVISKDYNLVPPNEEVAWLYDNGYSLTESRMYYINGYFYLVYQTPSDSTCNFYGVYETNIISFNLDFEELNSVN